MGGFSAICGNRRQGLGRQLVVERRDDGHGPGAVLGVALTRKDGLAVFDSAAPASTGTRPAFCSQTI